MVKSIYQTVEHGLIFYCFIMFIKHTIMIATDVNHVRQTAVHVKTVRATPKYSYIQNNKPTPGSIGRVTNIQTIGLKKSFYQA